MSRLPLTSKHREAGKQDIVQTFDPVKHHDANAARFFNYVNLCLGNKFSTMRSARIKNPLCRPGNLSLTVAWDDTDRDKVDDEFCHAHSEHLRGRCQRQQRQQVARHALTEFSEFVKREGSSVLASDASDCRDRDVRCCRRRAGDNHGGLLPYAITSAPVGQVLRDGSAGTETAKTV